MHRPLRHLLGAALALPLLAAIAAVAQTEQTGEPTQPDPGQVFEGSTSIQLIEVPVRVLQRGEPLRGLTKEDFEIFDNGERREISGFEIVDATAEWVPETLPTGDVLPPQERRNFLFLFDFAYGGLGMIDARRRLIESAEAVRTMIETELHPSDRIAIAFFSSLRGLKVVADFTRDREPVMMAMHAIDLILDAKPKLIKQELDGWALLGPDLEGREAKTPLGPNRPSLDDLISEARNWGQRGDPFLQHDNIVKHFTWGVREFTERHADLPGMNYMVLISRGVLYGDTQERVRSLLQEMFRDLRQQNWSIQAIDTGGLGFGRDSLVQLTSETGGRLFTNSRDFDLLLTEVAETTSVTYMLAFQVEDLPEDGAYHKIEVRLVDGPEKAQLSHRPGYYAPGMIEPLWERSRTSPAPIDR